MEVLSECSSVKSEFILSETVLGSLHVYRHAQRLESGSNSSGVNLSLLSVCDVISSKSLLRKDKQDLTVKIQSTSEVD